MNHKHNFWGVLNRHCAQPLLKDHTVFIFAVGNTLHFRFDIGNGIQTLEKITAYPLNDNHWHTILVERNRKQAMLKVDQQAQVSLDEPIDQGFRTLDLSSPLVIGM